DERGKQCCQLGDFLAKCGDFPNLSDIFVKSDYKNNDLTKLSFSPYFVRLSGCSLLNRSCKVLASVLSSQSSGLIELNLSYNDLQDSGLMLSSADLESPHCKLEALRLSECNLSYESCDALASVLSNQSSRLVKLDLRNNDLHDSGANLLSAGLKSPHCKLEILRLEQPMMPLCTNILYLYNTIQYISPVFSYNCIIHGRQFPMLVKLHRLNFPQSTSFQNIIFCS
uniref:SPRY-associated domain-containing protein n=1 Tax=Monopterus albus TaxID=43700 RepID=A0A3Q3JK74_MONAL